LIQCRFSKILVECTNGYWSSFFMGGGIPKKPSQKSENSPGKKKNKKKPKE
jgi:hypothetical protein